MAVSKEKTAVEQTVAEKAVAKAHLYRQNPFIQRRSWRQMQESCSGSEQNVRRRH